VVVATAIASVAAVATATYCLLAWLLASCLQLAAPCLLLQLLLLVAYGLLSAAAFSDLRASTLAY
jgi:hypothetical protein